MDTAPKPEPWWQQPVSRRQFILRVGWGLGYGSLLSWAMATLRYMFPNVLYEPSAVFKAGLPSAYEVGTVTTKWVREQRTWIIRNAQGIYALWARCTHLGCTPNWFDNERRFKCPCHGSNFNIDGDVIAGPAPKPLFRAAVSLAEDGQLQIDKAQLENRPGKREGGAFFLPYKSA